MTGGTFAVGDQEWDLDDIAHWRRLYEATGRPGSVAALEIGGIVIGGHGGTAHDLIVRVWYVPQTRVLVRAETRPATGADQV